MDAQAVARAVLVGWVVVGLVVWVAMRRRGHDSFSWLVFGLFLGPLALVIALDPWRRTEARRAPAGPMGLDDGPSGPVDVLAGYDGSPASGAAIAAAVDLLGPRLGRLTLATVIPYEADPAAKPHALAALQRLAHRYADRQPQLRVLEGYPSTALAALAVEDGYDLLAVGTRGRGLSRRVLGSAATELAKDSKVPVLLSGGAGEAGAPARDETLSGVRA